MFCGKCGTKNPNDNRYCVKCGADFETMTPQPDKVRDKGDEATIAGDSEDIAISSPSLHDLGDAATIGRPLEGIFAYSPGNLIGNRYEVQELLGQGGMGAVYKVHDNALDEIIALKIMSPKLVGSEAALERFRNEVRVSRKLVHENIIRVIDFGEDGDSKYYTMEYLDGYSLRKWLNSKKSKGQQVTLKETAGLMRRLCSGLSYAHQHTVHRDLKPENIMITRDSKVKILDFGIAKLMSAKQLTATKARLGTPYYVAPEQRIDGHKVDHRADIYSLGVILYELLTGMSC